MNLSESYRKRLQELAGINSDCNNIKITDEMIKELESFKDFDSFIKRGGFSTEILDKAAFGFSAEDIKTLMPEQLNIRWFDDYENVVWEQKNSKLTPEKWAREINIKDPIEVSFMGGKFYIEDGHHRYYAAKILNKPLNVELEIKDRPIDVIAPNMKYEDFLRCVFNKIKK
jgi:hypothetical protein